MLSGAPDAVAGIGSRLGPTADRVFAEQVKTAMTKGIAGQKTTASDIDGACAATLNASK